MVFNYHLIEATRSLIRIRLHFSTHDDVFRNYDLVLKCLMELTDCSKNDCKEAMESVYRSESQLNAQG